MKFPTNKRPKENCSCVSFDFIHCRDLTMAKRGKYVEVFLAEWKQLYKFSKHCTLIFLVVILHQYLSMTISIEIKKKENKSSIMRGFNDYSSMKRSVLLSSMIQTLSLPVHHYKKITM